MTIKQKASTNAYIRLYNYQHSTDYGLDNIYVENVFMEIKPTLFNSLLLGLVATSGPFVIFFILKNAWQFLN